MENDLCPINTEIVVNKNILVCDIVYKPNETVFLQWAKKNNLKVIYGIDMLINQALEAFNIWTGISTCSDDFKHIKKLYEENI